MMSDTYYGQPNLVPPQFLLQGLFGHLQGQQGQSIWPPFGGPTQQQFSGFMPPSLFGHLSGQYGQQPIWPTFGAGQGQGPFGGFVPAGLLGHLSGQYGQQPIWPTFGGGGLGQFAPVAPYLQGQFGQQGGHFLGGWPGQQLASQLGIGIGQLGPFAPPLGMLGQLHSLGQLYSMGALGRGILPYPGVPQMAYAGC